MPRFYADMLLLPGCVVSLPESAARHVQVLRLQPGDALTLFNGDGSAGEGEYSAVVTQMGRREVSVAVGAFVPTQREAVYPLHIAIGMPANERMDWLVEKAAELGAASIQPLSCERTVLRLDAERALKKTAHWQGVAQAACEQSGRSRVLHIHPPARLADWLSGLPAAAALGLATASAQPPPLRWLLSLQPGSAPLRQQLSASGLTVQPTHEQAVVFLSGPEGGFSSAEEAAARLAGFTAVSLGPRVLRSETAPLAVLAALNLG